MEKRVKNSNNVEPWYPYIAAFSHIITAISLMVIAASLISRPVSA